MSQEYDEGGEQTYQGDGPNRGPDRYVPRDSFVARIVENPKEPPEVLLLSGYLGASSEEGHVRLYLDEELRRYVEIPEDAIRHSQELPPEQSPLGGSLVWIDRKAEVMHGPAGGERRKATFFEGQIAQDYMGGASDEAGAARAAVPPPRTQYSPICAEAHILPTDMGPRCRTRTGIFCTRFGPNCHTVLVNQCISVHYPCITQNKFDCQVSGVAPCYPPVDVTIWEQQFGGQVAFAAQRAGVPGGGGPTLPPPTSVTVCHPVSHFVAACFTRFPAECQLETAVGCPSFDIPCQTVSHPRCFVSQVAACGVTRSGCEVASVACGVDPAGVGAGFYPPPPTTGWHCGSRGCEDVPGGGTILPPPSMAVRCWQHHFSVACGGGGEQQMGASHFCPYTHNTNTCVPRQCYGPVDPVGTPYEARAAIQPSQFVRCPSMLDACPTRFNCPSRYTPCQSQLSRCPSALDACPTRFNCPSVSAPCVTQDFSCETRGACPSAVDACPTRFGCQETHLCAATQGCFNEGGGGYNPGGY